MPLSSAPRHVLRLQPFTARLPRASPAPRRRSLTFRPRAPSRKLRAQGPHLAAARWPPAAHFPKRIWPAFGDASTCRCSNLSLRLLQRLLGGQSLDSGRANRPESTAQGHHPCDGSLATRSSPSRVKFRAQLAKPLRAAAPPFCLERSAAAAGSRHSPIQQNCAADGPQFGGDSAPLDRLHLGTAHSKFHTPLALSDVLHLAELAALKLRVVASLPLAPKPNVGATRQSCGSVVVAQSRRRFWSGPVTPRPSSPWIVHWGRISRVSGVGSNGTADRRWHSDSRPAVRHTRSRCLTQSRLPEGKLQSRLGSKGI